MKLLYLCPECKFVHNSNFLTNQFSDLNYSFLHFISSASVTVLTQNIRNDTVEEFPFTIIQFYFILVSLFKFQFSIYLYQKLQSVKFDFDHYF